MRVVVGLGSNVGDRLEVFRRAEGALSTVGVVAQRSRIYETAPIGPDQPAFLNAAVALDTALSPADLLRELRAIERSLGRRREVELRWGPRTLDLDVLWIEGLAVSEPELIVPHPRLPERAFAIAPLLEVAPQAVCPTTGMAYRVPPDQDIRVTDLAWSER